MFARGGMVMVVLLWGSVVTVRGEQISLTLRNTLGLPTAATDQHGQAFTIGEMSGVTHLGGTTFAAVTDDGGKVVEFSVTFDGVGNLQTAVVTSGLTLATVQDFEGIAFTDATAGTAFISEEDSPGVHEYRLSDGAIVGSLTIPAVFGHRRSNRGFESLTRVGSSGDLWTANEEALDVDGPIASETHGTTVRMLRMANGGSGYQAAEQFAYEVEALHGQAISGSRSGLVDLVAMPIATSSGRLLAVERSLAFSAELGVFLTSVYVVDTATATDVSGMSSLSSASYVAAKKQELFSGGVVPGGMNLEGLAVGPSLGPGHWAAVGVVDDGDPISINALVAFELVILPDGDVNGDAVVDGIDANIISANWMLSPATREEGDLNGDGMVNGLDANVVSADWGSTTNVEAAPEPGAMGLLLFSTWLAAGRMRIH